MRAWHCSQTTAKITTRLNSAGTAQNRQETPEVEPTE
jgi:hypothetical protein